MGPACGLSPSSSRAHGEGDRDGSGKAASGEGRGSLAGRGEYIVILQGSHGRAPADPHVVPGPEAGYLGQEDR